MVQTLNLLLITVQKNALELTHILNTHTHGDHIGINRELLKMGILNQVTVIGSLHALPIPGLTTQ